MALFAYQGNWLRGECHYKECPGGAILKVSQIRFRLDFSQAMDVASLTKVSSQTIINLCMVLGFLAHGKAVFFFYMLIFWSLRLMREIFVE